MSIRDEEALFNSIVPILPIQQLEAPEAAIKNNNNYENNSSFLSKNTNDITSPFNLNTKKKPSRLRLTQSVSKLELSVKDNNLNIISPLDDIKDMDKLNKEIEIQRQIYE